MITEREVSWYRELKLCLFDQLSLMWIETRMSSLFRTPLHLPRPCCFSSMSSFPCTPWLLEAECWECQLWTTNPTHIYYHLFITIAHGWWYFLNVSPIEMAIILRPSPIFSSKWNSFLGPRTFSGWWRNETRCDGALGLRFFAQWPDRSISDAHNQLSMTAWLL